MSFLYPQYLPFLIAGLVLLTWSMFRIKRRFWKFSELYWGKRPTFAQGISLFLFLMGLLLLGLALLDFRGAEKLVDSLKQERYTVILIDNSQSMLCEDVRPNRLQKAVMLARHLVKNSFQTKIAVMVFSETTKKLVPFTSDRDLIDARLMSLEQSTELPSGGTRLKQSMREALQELFTQAGDQGSLVVLSDAESWDDSFELSTSKNVHVAFIAVGTAKGGPIPLRDKRGRFIDQKKSHGQIINTALDEKFLKSLSGSFPNYRYWIASSYSLPTEEVIGFLQQTGKVGDQKSLTRNRDSYFDFFLIPAVVFMLLSLLIRRWIRPYRVISFLLFGILLINVNNQIAWAQHPPQQATAKPTYSPKVKEYFRLWKRGDLQDDEKRDLALELLKSGFAKSSQTLYSEIRGKRSLEGDLIDLWNNEAIAKSKNKDLKAAIKQLVELQVFLELVDPEQKSDPITKISKLVRENILSLTIQQQQQQQDQQNQQKNEEKSEQKKDGKKDPQDENGQGDKQKDKKENDDGENKKDEDKDKNKKEEKESKSPQKEQAKSQDYKKLPAIIKQLMNEDRELQKYLLDTTTKNKNKGSNDEKDW